MHIHLPNSAFIGNIDSFLRQFDPSNPSSLEVTSNPKWISVHPAVLTMLASLGAQLQSKNIKVQDFTAKSKTYFERLGLYPYLGLKASTTLTHHEAAGRFIPITRIKDSLTLTHFVSDIIPLLHVDPQAAESIRYIVSELVRNVLEHSESPQGAFVAAQYYPKSNTIKIGVADTGIGIKQSINHAHTANTDLEAIHLALQPGITGTTVNEGGTAQNAGAGLFFIKSIAHVNHSHFMIYSGKGFYKLLKKNKKSLPFDPYLDNHTKYDNLPYWQGTLIGVDISLDNTPEFTSLLDLIRKSYSQAIKERKKARYHKPRFI